MEKKKNLKKQKIIYLSEENSRLLAELKTRLGFTTESQVVNYLVAQAGNNYMEKLAEAVRQELEKNYLPKDRIKLAVQTTERNSILLLDYANTMCFKEKLKSCIPVNMTMSPVLSESLEHEKERIGYFKQKKDERKSKGEIL